MHRERCALPRKIFGVRVNDHVLVAERKRHADFGVRIPPQTRLQIAGVNPKGQRRVRRVIKRRLSAFLFPQLFLRGVLDRQPIPAREPLHVGVMPQLVARFKKRRGDGIERAEKHKQRDEKINRAFAL